MAIALSAEQESVIDQGIEAGIVSNAEIAIEVGVATIRQQLKTYSPRGNHFSHEEWSRKLQEFVDRERPEAPLLSEYDISRESIY